MLCICFRLSLKRCSESIFSFTACAWVDASVDCVDCRSDRYCLRLRRAHINAVITPIRAAPSMPPTTPPTSAVELDGLLHCAAEALAAQVVFELLATGAELSVELYVVLIAVLEPGKRRLPMCDVEIIDALFPQQLPVSDAALQQNLPGSHWRTFHEYWFPMNEHSFGHPSALPV